jgi:hypothetical protein
MLRALYLALLSWLVSVSGCARSAIPLGTGSEAAGTQAQAAQPREDLPRVDDSDLSCDACFQHLPPRDSLRCVCRLANCPADLRHAVSNLQDFAAYANACNLAWFVRRSDKGYDLFVYGLETGRLIYAQHAGAQPLICADEPPNLLVSGGQDPMCEAPDWCRFAHVDYTIGIGELDSVKVCDEGKLR